MFYQSLPSVPENLPKKEIKKYSSLDPSVPYVEIIFKDNGIGFDQKYAKKIFTIFQRLHDKETYNGTGIGLALCKQICVSAMMYVEKIEVNWKRIHVRRPQSTVHSNI